MPYNVLFICTGNSARSILAEGILNALGQGRFRAFSAGSQPKGQVHPLALTTLERLQLPASGYRSKSWDEFAQPQAPQMDFIFTVCDSAAGEACPLWPGQPVSAHWGLADPAAVSGSAAQQLQAFRETAMVLRRRIELLLALPLERLDRMSLQRELRHIGQQHTSPTMDLKGHAMPDIQIFDPALCCSTGVCGAEVDQQLVQFAADANWAQQNGAQIERFNLAQQPLAFAEHAVVKAFLERSGVQALPLVLVDGAIALAGRYPGRSELARWAGLQVAEAHADANVQVNAQASSASAGACCGGSRCC